MVVYQEGIGDRIPDERGKEFPPLPRGRAERERSGYLLILHPPDRLHAWLNEKMGKSEYAQDPACRAILFVKGAPYGGLARQKAKRWEERLRSIKPVHFLSYGIAERADITGPLRERFARFFEGVTRENRLDWNILDPEWPEHAVALYLLACAFQRLGTGVGAKRVMIEKNAISRVCELAEKELPGDLTQLPALEPGTALDVVQRLRQVVRNLPEIPCEVDSKRYRFSHTWLKRTLLTDLLCKRGEWAAEPSNTPLPKLLAVLPERVADLNEFAARVLPGFSPAQLVDSGSLSIFSDEARRFIRETVNDIYIGSGVVQPAVAKLMSAITDFSAAARRIPSAWAAGGAARITALEELKTAAERLQKTLAKKLPKGVVIP